MTTQKLYERLAEAFYAEQTAVLFTLLGDGNMHWAIALEEKGVKTIHSRHEHAACSMAMSYANNLDRIGVVSVTCGPGLTQLSTALATAARANLPIVVFAGEAPMGSAWYNQQIDQAPIVTATGTRYIPIHSAKLALTQVREAFLYARTSRQPVVIGVPFDLQQQVVEVTPYIPSHEVLGETGRTMPDPDQVAVIAERINDAHKIIVLAGRGAKRSGAAKNCVELAEACGALLSTTLPVRGLFHDHPYNIGIAGGFSATVTQEKFKEADLVIAVGAGITHHTANGGKLFPNAAVVQIDTAPTGTNQGRIVANHFLRSDAAAAIDALLPLLDGRSLDGEWRSHELAQRLLNEPADATEFPRSEGLLDPREVISTLDELLPKDWQMVNGSGHSSYFAAHMEGRPAETFNTIREFGAIGNGLSYSIGVAAARPDTPVALIDGDGGIMMHIQELDTLQRHGMKILICTINDGGFGSEFHKLRADGLNDQPAISGRGDYGAIARGFGLQGTVVRSLDELAPAIETFKNGNTSTLLDIHVSDQVISPVMRQSHPHKETR